MKKQKHEENNLINKSKSEIDISRFSKIASPTRFMGIDIQIKNSIPKSSVQISSTRMSGR
jgi:hypothetical protein